MQLLAPDFPRRPLSSVALLHSDIKLVASSPHLQTLLQVFSEDRSAEPIFCKRFSYGGKFIQPRQTRDDLRRGNLGALVHTHRGGLSPCPGPIPQRNGFIKTCLVFLRLRLSSLQLK